MKSAALAGALALASALSGCATVIAGGPDTIPIQTNPPGAYVYLNGTVVGQTPMMLDVPRGSSMADIRIYYPGFMPVQYTRYKSLNPWIFGNFFLAIFPVIVDFATDNWQRYSDEPIAIGLTPGQAQAPYGMPPQTPQPL